MVSCGGLLVIGNPAVLHFAERCQPRPTSTERPHLHRRVCKSFGDRLWFVQHIWSLASTETNHQHQKARPGITAPPVPGIQSPGIRTIPRVSCMGLFYFRSHPEFRGFQGGKRVLWPFHHCINLINRTGTEQLVLLDDKLQ